MTGSARPLTFPAKSPKPRWLIRSPTRSSLDGRAGQACPMQDFEQPNQSARAKGTVLRRRLNRETMNHDLFLQLGLVRNAQGHSFYICSNFEVNGNSRRSRSGHHENRQRSFSLLHERCLLRDIAEFGDASIADPAHKFVNGAEGNEEPFARLHGFSKAVTGGEVQPCRSKCPMD